MLMPSSQFVGWSVQPPSDSIFRWMRLKKMRSNLPKPQQVDFFCQQVTYRCSNLKTDNHLSLSYWVILCYVFGSWNHLDAGYLYRIVNCFFPPAKFRSCVWSVRGLRLKLSLTANLPILARLTGDSGPMHKAIPFHNALHHQIYSVLVWLYLSDVARKQTTVHRMNWLTCSSSKT